MKKEEMKELDKRVVQKELLKQKPVATRFATPKNTWLYDAMISIDGIEYQLMFGVPVTDMGDKEFKQEEPAQLLFRWYETSHVI